ncbi:MAG: sulfite exporter TauE/SafE family protein [Rhodospirillaceae bacterium]|nr:sulfite exporter TauE/SafE family protein [Rhodospirillaceae bacterium]
MDISGVSIATAFLAGMVSFLSPCVLPLVPGYISYIAGRSASDLSDDRRFRTRIATLALSGNFVLGFSAVFIALGASATALGQLFQSYRGEADIVAGAIIMIFGLHLTGILKLSFLNRDIRPLNPQMGGSVFGPFLLGAAFAFGWTPCIGPILGAVLTMSALSASVSGGIALLSIYSLGLAIPFLLVALFTGEFTRWIRKFGRASRVLQVGSGVLLAVAGIGMMTGYLTSLGTWLLVTFPAFQTILL